MIKCKFVFAHYLQGKEDELKIQVNEVGHEGDLCDGTPPAPGEEIVDNPTQSAAAGEDQPRQADSPHHVAASVPEPCYALPGVNVLKVGVVGCVDQSKEEE